MSEPRSMEGRVAIVSGAGEGIGRSSALALARDGADVALGGRRPDQLERVAAEVRALGRRALGVPTDIADEARCRELVETTVGEFGRLDAVVNVAALSVDEATVEEVSRSDWERALTVNLFGTMEVSRAASKSSGARSACSRGFWRSTAGVYGGGSRSGSASAAWHATT